MRIRYSTLRRIIREVAVSPSAFRDNQPISDPMDRSSVAKVVATIEEPFRRAIEQNMMLAAKGSYNAETREFDDAAYERIQTASQKAAETVVARVHRAIQQTWQEAMRGEAPGKKAA